MSPLLQDRRLQRIQHLSPTQQVQSQHDYTHDVEGRIQTWDMQAADRKRYEFGYNASDELEQALLKQLPSNTLLQTNQYGYDPSANRVSVQRDAELTSFGTNARNQLTTSSGNGLMKFRGTVSKDSGITLSGYPGIVTGSALTGFTWEATSPVAPGPNHLELRATEVRDIADVNAQTTVRHIDINVTTGVPRTLGYDGNGSVTNNGAGQTYEWDAANRMSAINYTGTNERTEFGYDGVGNRVRIVEKAGATVISDKRFVWDGAEMVEERDALNIVVKQFYQEGVRVSGTNYYNARDHLGSIRELTDAAGIIRARYEYDAWGERVKIAGNLDADFGFTGHYQHDRSGLVVSPSRFYLPPLGRWLSRDPIEEDGGINLYSYVANDPAGRIDPDGLDSIPSPNGTNIFVVNPNSFGARNLNQLALQLQGRFVQHPKERLSGQCATGAQYLTGTKVENGFRDAPSTSSWQQGRSIDGTTLPGTMIASGWNNQGQYPNQPSGNHTGIYLGGNQILEQNFGNPGSYQRRTLTPGELSRFNEVTSREKYDSRPSKCSVGGTRNP